MSQMYHINCGNSLNHFYQSDDIEDIQQKVAAETTPVCVINIKAPCR